MAQKILFLLMVFAVSLNAFADDLIGDTRDNAWYISAGTGIADIEYQYPNRSDFKDQASAYNVSVGINVLTHFAIELGYYDLALVSDDVELGVSQGSNLIADDSLELDLFMVAAVGRLSVGESVLVVGKIGFGNWTSRESISGLNDSDSGIDIIPSVGVEFSVSQHFDVVADVLFLKIEPAHFSQKTTLDVQLWSLGIKYSF